MTAKRLDKLLNSGTGSLEKLIQTAQNMDSLSTALRAVLPADHAPALIAANHRDDGELVVICATSAWASRLRFHATELQAAAKAAGFDAVRVRVTVSRQTAAEPAADSETG